MKLSTALPVLALTALSSSTVLAAKDKDSGGINRADTAGCVIDGNAYCGQNECCMFYWGFGCYATTDGVYTDRYPWMKCYDPAVPVPASAEGVTDEQIAEANAILEACPEDATAIEDCEAAVTDLAETSSGPVKAAAPLAVATVMAAVGMMN